MDDDLRWGLIYAHNRATRTRASWRRWRRRSRRSSRCWWRRAWTRSASTPCGRRRRSGCAAASRSAGWRHPAGVRRPQARVDRRRRHRLRGAHPPVPRGLLQARRGPLHRGRARGDPAVGPGGAVRARARRRRLVRPHGARLVPLHGLRARPIPCRGSTAARTAASGWTSRAVRTRRSRTRTGPAAWTRAASSTQSPGPEHAAPEVELDVADAVEAPGLVGGAAGAGLGAAVMAGDPQKGLTPQRVMALSARAGDAGVARMLARLETSICSGIPSRHAAARAEAGAERRRQEPARQRQGADRQGEGEQGRRDEGPRRLQQRGAGPADDAEDHGGQEPGDAQGGRPEGSTTSSAEAKEVAKIQDEVLMQIVGAALGGLGSGAPRAHRRPRLRGQRATSPKGDEGADRVRARDDGREVRRRRREPRAPWAWAPGIKRGPARAATPWTTRARRRSSRSTRASRRCTATPRPLLKQAVDAAKISEPIGKVTEAIAGVRDAGITRSDYPVTKIDKDAATLESASRGLAAAAPGIQPAPRRPQGPRPAVNRLTAPKNPARGREGDLGRPGRPG